MDNGEQRLRSRVRRRSTGGRKEWARHQETDKLLLEIDVLIAKKIACMDKVDATEELDAAWEDMMNKKIMKDVLLREQTLALRK